MNLNTKCYKMNSKPLCAAIIIRDETVYSLQLFSVGTRIVSRNHQELDVMLQSQAIQAPILLN